MTYSELMKKIYEGDPLAYEDNTILLNEEGLIIFGYDNENGSCSDLKIKIVNDTYVFWYRDPYNCQDPCYGREWMGPSDEYVDYEEMVSSIYCL